MREKLRKITAAAGNHEHISEQSKRAGMLTFFLFAGIGLLALICFSLALFIYQQYVGALITIAGTAFIGYLLYKIQSADDIPRD